MTGGEKPKDDPQAELTRALARLGNTMADAKDREEAKPEKRGEVIQFPLFPEETRPVSNDVARSALFSCVQGKDRQTVKDTLIATVEGVQIRFTGERFNQDDHDVLMQLVHMAAHKPLGEYVTIPAYALLKTLGRRTGGKDHQQLKADLTRLIAGTVSLRNSKTKVEYIGHIVDDAMQDEESRYWVFKLNPKLRPLYGTANHTLIDWERRKSLRGKDLARWLQLYLASHAAPFPVKVATLRELSGSRAAELFKFRQGLRAALQDLASNGDIAEWAIDPVTDLVSISRGAALTNSQRRHLTKPKSRKKARV
jgi:hypothetical protein